MFPTIGISGRLMNTVPSVISFPKDGYFSCNSVRTYNSIDHGYIIIMQAIGTIIQNSLSMYFTKTLMSEFCLTSSGVIFTYSIFITSSFFAVEISLINYTSACLPYFNLIQLSCMQVINLSLLQFFQISPTVFLKLSGLFLRNSLARTTAENSNATLTTKNTIFIVHVYVYRNAHAHVRKILFLTTTPITSLIRYRR